MFDRDYYLDKFKELLAIDSTTGLYREIQEYIVAECAKLGIDAFECNKGGVIADLGGTGDALCITAHLDDIGLMVRHINADGTLNVCSVGGLHPFNCFAENVRILTRDGKVYTGTVCRTPNSIHVTEEETRGTLLNYRKNVCVVLDADVKNASDVRALGIETGDYISLEPRFAISNGYLKSRFIDDKACAAVMLAAMNEIKTRKTGRKVYFYFSVYEEIGHGTSYLPNDVKDIVAIDIAPTGPEQNSDERKVSVFAQDSRAPYHYELTNELRELAINNGIDYVMDVFTPHYGSDGETSITAGYDVRHAAIGPGTANSHGYERTHIDGIKNTYDLLMALLK